MAAVVVTGMLVVIPAFADQMTGQQLMEAVVENLRGPHGTMMVGIGKIVSPHMHSDVTLGRSVDGTEEGVHIDVLSAVNEVGTGGRGGQKYRVIRRENEVSSLTYLPGLGRGRKRPFIPLDQVMETDQVYYFFPMVGNLRYDFEYTCTKCDTDDPVVSAVRKSNQAPEIAPFPSSTWYLKRIGSVYVPIRVEYYLEADAPKAFAIQIYKGYAEVEGAPGYLAPQAIETGETKLTFERWFVRPPIDWILSSNNQTIGIQTLPAYP